MKKSIFMFAGLAVFAVGAYFTSQLFAQPGGNTATQAGTKIACVNVGQVFNNYIRAKAFKEDLDRAVAPFKDEGKKLIDEIKQWEVKSQSPTFNPKDREQAERVILQNKRKLEDMQREIQKLIGERQKSNMMTLWNEINMGIEAVSKSAGYQVVLAYGDPVEKDELVKFENVSRKMNAMDNAALIPIYVHGSADISTWVTDTLNSWVKNAQKK